MDWHQDDKGNLHGPQHGKRLIHEFAHYVASSGFWSCGDANQIRHAEILVPYMDRVGVQVHHCHQPMILKTA